MISVVIPTYNRLSFLKETIRSLEKQSLPLNKFEVIVVDDGSSDGTYKWLCDYRGKLNLVCIRHHENKCRANARNDGIRTAKGDIIVFLDDDVKPGEDLLFTYFEAHKMEDAVFIGNVIYERNSRERSLIRYLSTRGVHKGKRDFTCFITQNVSLKRKDAIDIGLFDESVPIGEDIEFGYKLSLLGKRFVYLKGAFAYHSHTVNLQKVLYDAEKLGKYSLPYLLNKHPHLRLTFRLHLLEPVHQGQEPILLSFQKIFVSLFLHPDVHFLIKLSVGVFNSIFVPSIFFDYLIFYNRTKWIHPKISL
jgi:glycosyltransferase involved in cell wall biosynthesis